MAENITGFISSSDWHDGIPKGDHGEGAGGASKPGGNEKDPSEGVQAVDTVDNPDGVPLAGAIKLSQHPLMSMRRPLSPDFPLLASIVFVACASNHAAWRSRFSCRLCLTFS